MLEEKCDNSKTFALEAESFPGLDPVAKPIISSNTSSADSYSFSTTTTTSIASSSSSTSVMSAMANLITPKPPSYLANERPGGCGISLADLPMKSVSRGNNNKYKNKQDQPQWNCKTCTFANSPHLSTCEMCDACR
jgi:hypothetical protein